MVANFLQLFMQHPNHSQLLIAWLCVSVIIDSPRGVSTGDVHNEWINRVVIPFVNGEPAALIVDSAPGHKPDKCTILAEQWGIATIKVPKHRTGEQ